MSTREGAGNDYHVHRRWRSSHCHSLLLGEESATNGNAGDHRCTETVGVFPCSGYRPKSADDWHNTGLTVIQEDNDHLTQEWSYQFKGKTGEDTFCFTRVRPGAT